MHGLSKAVVVVSLIVVIVASLITRYRPPMACVLASQNHGGHKTSIDSGFSFGSGGLLVAYHIGVVEFIQEKHRQMGQTVPLVPLAGASCGVLAALALRLDLPSDSMKRSFWGLLKHMRENGSPSAVSYLRDQLEVMLPENAHEICNRGSNFYVELSSSSTFGPIFVTLFESRANLIDVVCASCTVPFVTHTGGADMTPWVSDGLFINRCDSRIAPMTPVDCFSFPWQPMPSHGEIRHFPMLHRDFLSAVLIPDKDERYDDLMRKGYADAGKSITPG